MPDMNARIDDNQGLYRNSKKLSDDLDALLMYYRELKAVSENASPHWQDENRRVFDVKMDEIIGTLENEIRGIKDILESFVARHIALSEAIGNIWKK